MINSKGEKLKHTYQVPVIKSKEIENGQIAVLIPYENLKGEVKYYSLVKTKQDKLNIDVVK